MNCGQHKLLSLGVKCWVCISGSVFGSCFIFFKIFFQYLVLKVDWSWGFCIFIFFFYKSFIFRINHLFIDFLYIFYFKFVVVNYYLLIIFFMINIFIFKSWWYILIILFKVRVIEIVLGISNCWLWKLVKEGIFINTLKLITACILFIWWLSLIIFKFVFTFLIYSVILIILILINWLIYNFFFIFSKHFS